MNTDGFDSSFEHVRKDFNFIFFPSWFVIFVLSETEHTKQSRLDAPSRFFYWVFFVSLRSLFDVFCDFW